MLGVNDSIFLSAEASVGIRQRFSSRRRHSSRMGNINRRNQRCVLQAYPTAFSSISSDEITRIDFHQEPTTAPCPFCGVSRNRSELRQFHLGYPWLRATHLTDHLLQCRCPTRRIGRLPSRALGSDRSPATCSTPSSDQRHIDVPTGPYRVRNHIGFRDDAIESADNSAFIFWSECAAGSHVYSPRP
ncbi:hypothetical protein SRABI112_01989 [Pseudomonas mediterranea]|uniref:Transposase IS66 zinc-finger binding domain-containing protein n=1 Tax=Pseudomonas mediterranea TaxID=183795 RepID=A0AAX2DDR5_9PSED|nr:hypothetical protein SRABI112_01989 [Pseudomonas mediterranea]SDU48807.1 hypothetical protein SAMN05216476_2513 [Pseudomonas mediterranea]